MNCTDESRLQVTSNSFDASWEVKNKQPSILSVQELDRSVRNCLLYNRQEIGDEFHYLLVCPFFNSECKRFMEK